MTRVQVHIIIYQFFWEYVDSFILFKACEHKLVHFTTICQRFDKWYTGLDRTTDVTNRLSEVEIG